jgi:hypothetical protein
MNDTHDVYLMDGADFFKLRSVMRLLYDAQKPLTLDETRDVAHSLWLICGQTEGMSLAELNARKAP